MIDQSPKMEIISEFLVTISRMVVEANKLAIPIEKISRRAAARWQLEKTFKTLSAKCGYQFTMSPSVLEGGDEKTTSPCKTLHSELSKIKRTLEQVGEVSADALIEVIKNFNGNTTRTYNRLRAFLMTPENEKECEDEKEMHKEVLEKALTLFEEILDSLNNLAEVQITRLKLIEAYKEISFAANISTPAMREELPEVKEKYKERMRNSLDTIDNFCRALANINQTDLELWSIRKGPFNEEDLLTSSESDQISCFTSSPSYQEFTKMIEAITTLERKVARLESGETEGESSQLELVTGVERSQGKMPPLCDSGEEEIYPSGSNVNAKLLTRKEAPVERSEEVPTNYKNGRVSENTYEPHKGANQLTDTPVGTSSRIPSKRLFSEDYRGRSTDNQTGDEESDEGSDNEGDRTSSRKDREARNSRDRGPLPRYNVKGGDIREANKIGKLNRKFFMLEEATKSLKNKLKEDKKNGCYKYINVRNGSCKELFKIFNSLNEEAYFTNEQVGAWHKELVELTEDIQLR